MATQVDELNKLMGLTEEEENEIIDDEEAPTGEETDADADADVDAGDEEEKTRLTDADNVNIDKAKKFIQMAISNDVNDKDTMTAVARDFFNFILDQIPADGNRATLMRTLGAEFMKASREEA